MSSAESATSTVPPGDSGARPWEFGLRRLSVGVIVLLPVLGLLGVFGVRTTTAQAASGGLSMSVRYAAVSRPGLATPLFIKVWTEDGTALPATVSIRVASPYLAMFDENGLAPQPRSSYRTDEWTWWRFDVQGGASHLEFSLDARLEPAVQWGHEASAAVEIDGREVVAVDFATRVMP